MNVETLRDTLKYRSYIEKISCGEWEDEIENCRNKEIKILSADILSTISFLKNDCNSEEYVWISEVIDDVVEQTQSMEIVEAYNTLREKYPDESEKYNIVNVVQLTEKLLNTGDSHVEKD